MKTYRAIEPKGVEEFLRDPWGFLSYGVDVDFGNFPRPIQIPLNVSYMVPKIYL